VKHLFALALALSGCVERYVIPESAFEQTLDLDRLQRGRAAFPAVRLEDGKNVWVLNRRIRVAADVNSLGMVKARRTRPTMMTFYGTLLTVLGGGLFFGLGGAALADLPNADKDAAECRRVNGFFCGLGSGFERGFGGLSVFLGFASTIAGSVMIYYGTVRSAEVKPGLREHIYLRPRKPLDDND
jgi:hypothetical protein